MVQVHLGPPSFRPWSADNFLVLRLAVLTGDRALKAAKRSKSADDAVASRARRFHRPPPRHRPDDDAPYAEDPEASRPHVAALRELAAEHGLHHLSVGTSQDYRVAAEEGATIVCVGSVLYG